ncbi:MAG: hypothetical protein QNJ60_05745 [Xenococcaceae cyanobacterium MO_188.B19]|nr:hypothetical protein [Xenococcaceae cyanobacterium MO_188.B19]
MKISLARIIRIIFFTTVISAVNAELALALSIQGNSGGSINSKDCGFIASSPHHTMRLNQRMDYMRLTVKAKGGQPTLLIVEPKTGRRFCALGDQRAGLVPEISGSWEPGEYKVYVGERTRNRYQFTLRISTTR